MKSAIRYFVGRRRGGRARRCVSRDGLPPARHGARAAGGRSAEIRRGGRHVREGGALLRLRQPHSRGRQRPGRTTSAPGRRHRTTGSGSMGCLCPTRTIRRSPFRVTTSTSSSSSPTPCIARTSRRRRTETTTIEALNAGINSYLVVSEKFRPARRRRIQLRVSRETAGRHREGTPETRPWRRGIGEPARERGHSGKGHG